MKTSFILLAATLLLAAGISSVSAQEPLFNGEGTSDHPYLIQSTSDLNALAASVNNGNDYEGVYFQLADYLDYSGKTYTPIGTVIPGTDTEDPIERPFKGIFDGNFKSISGITINAPDQDYIGVFGYVLGSGSEINNLVVTNSTFTGDQYVGGIVGYDKDGGIKCCNNIEVAVSGENSVGGIAGYSSAYISQCRFSKDPENPNSPGTVSGILSEIGGIVGNNCGTIEGCYCDADIIGVNREPYYANMLGGIAGSLEMDASITDCIFEGTVTGYSGSSKGGILGEDLSGQTQAPRRKKATARTNEYEYYPLSRNYYNASDVKGIGNANGGKDFALADGALPCLVSKTIPFNTGDQIYDNDYYSVIGITVYEHCIHYNDNFYFSYVPLADQSNNTNILTTCLNTSYNRFKLNGRTLYKTGDWNTLCLPFSVIDNDPNDELTFSGTPLEGAIVKTLESSTLSSNGTLIMNFSKEDLTSIEAGKAYIVKWNKPDEEDEEAEEYEGNEEYEGDDSEYDNIQDPIFSDVTVTLYEPANSFPGTFDFLFLGCFDPYPLTPGDQTELYLGALNTLYYASENSNVTIGAFRGYFKYARTGTGSTPVKAFVLNFGDEETSIKQINNTESATDTYYTLDGRRLNDKPATAGLYIINGKKVVIK